MFINQMFHFAGLIQMNKASSFYRLESKGIATFLINIQRLSDKILRAPEGGTLGSFDNQQISLNPPEEVHALATAQGVKRGNTNHGIVTKRPGIHIHARSSTTQ